MTKTKYTVTYDAAASTVTVHHPKHGIVCMARVTVIEDSGPGRRPGRYVHDIEFTHTDYQRSNAIRQPAIDAIREWRDLTWVYPGGTRCH